MFELAGVKYKDILDIPQLIIASGRITTLMGPSGSGKSTLLKLLNKLYSPTEGRISYNGTDLAQTDSVLHRRRVAMLSQSAVMFPGTVRDNLLAGIRFQKKETPSDERLLAALDSVSLKKALDQPAQLLSGGEMQRLALGRVLLLDPDAYLLDEPSSALDEETAEAIIRMLAGHVKKAEKTLILVTHAKALSERYSDDIVEVIGGKCKKKEAAV